MHLTHPSPNFGERRIGGTPRLVVLHYTAMDSVDAALARLCDPQAEVSAHYLIREDGTVCALVEEGMRAWHAGSGSWGGCRDVNSRSIGIELDNDGARPFAERQMSALEELLADILDRHRIPPQGVIGHSDMAPDRKRDPGPRFDWRRLADKGLSVWPGIDIPEPEPVYFLSQDKLDELSEAASRFGYPRDVDQRWVFAAYRMRFPRPAGHPDRGDIAILRDLADRFPVDPGLADD